MEITRELFKQLQPLINTWMLTPVDRLDIQTQGLPCTSRTAQLHKLVYGHAYFDYDKVDVLFFGISETMNVVMQQLAIQGIFNWDGITQELPSAYTGEKVYETEF